MVTIKYKILQLTVFDRTSDLNAYWNEDEDIGSKVSCTLYFRGYLLEQITKKEKGKS